MSFDLKNVKNVHATQLGKQNFENAVSQNRHSHKRFTTLVLSLRYATITQLNLIDNTTHTIKIRHVLINLNMCRCVNLLMCSSVYILFNVEYFKSTMRQLSDEVRNQIIGQLQAGRRIADVARHFNICKRTVMRLRQKYHQAGSTKNLPKTGRPPKTTRQEDRNIVLTHLRNRFKTAESTKHEFNAVPTPIAVNFFLLPNGSFIVISSGFCCSYYV